MRTSGHHYEGDLTSDLLDRAAEVVAEAGPAAVGIRSLARDLDVSHTAPLKHFGGLQGLFTALATRGFDRLAAELAAAADDPSPTAGDRLAAVATAYVEMAIEVPGYFGVMWRSDLYDADDPRLRASAGRCIDLLESAVADAQAEGWMANRATGDLARSVWAGAHGWATLWPTQSFADLREHPADSIRHHVEVLLRDA